jgi:adenylyltransferase/sulfurtransferase
MLTPAELASIRRQAETEYPAECCGVLLVRPGSPPGRRLRPCRNIQDELHARDPERYARTSRTAYYIAHEDLLAISREQSAGWEVAVIYHSHVDAGAYFSETDRRNALVDGQPAYPGTVYVVVEVRAGRAEDMRAFRWDEARRDFAEVALAGVG